MNKLRVSLFQELRVDVAEGRPIDLGTPTTRSLLAYLILNRDQASDRRRLAFLFWPRATESAARRNLRQYLHRARRVLEPVGLDGKMILATGSQLQLNPEAPIWVDVEAFLQSAHPKASLAELEYALKLYAGDLLEDLYDEWCLEERERLRRVYVETLDRVSQALQMMGNADEALDYAKRWVEAEPLDETANRRLMSLLAVTGRRAQAMIQYQGLAETLARDLNAVPLPETKALNKAIQEGTFQAGQPIDVPAAPVRWEPWESPRATPLFGRDQELHHLEKMLECARKGRGGFVFITGDSGIGKTRLVQEYLSRGKHLLTLHKECHELESMVPYGSIQPMIERGLQSLPGAVLEPPPPWLMAIARIVPALHLPIPREVQPESLADTHVHLTRAFLSLAMCMRENAGGDTLHLIIDDLHWADNATWQFLAHLSRHADEFPLLIFGLCRLEDLPPGRDRLIRTLERNELLLHLPLQLLSKEDTTALVESLLSDQETNPLFLKRLFKETRGNPLFIIETIRAMRESNRVPSLPRSGGILRLPLSIQHVIEARLDRLGQKNRALLATAAVIGRSFSASLLEEISDASVEEIVRSIELWCRRGLVREREDGYIFAHEKIREAAQANLSHARGKYTYRRVADVLKDAFPPLNPATLAQYYARSDQPLKALPYLTRAGEQALRLRSYQEARQFGLRAVGLLGRMPSPSKRSQRIDLNLQLAQAYAFTGEVSHALEILSEAEQLAASLDDKTRKAKVFHRLSQYYWLRGQTEVAGDYARRALRVAEEIEDPQLIYGALRMVGRVSIALSAFDDAIAYLERYVRPMNSASPPGLSVVCGYLGVAYARVGSWRRAREAARRGLSNAEADGASQAVDFARMQLAFIDADQQNWRSCLRVLEPVGDLLEGEGDLTPHGFMLLGLRGRALAHIGEPGRGIETILPALDWAERSDYRVFHYLPRIFLAECYLLDQQLQKAQREAKKALRDSRQAGNRWATGITLRLLSEVHARMPNPDWQSMESNLIESMHLLRQIRARPDLARTYLALRRLYDRAGQIAWAVDCHFRASTIFEELRMAKELSQAQGQAAGERDGAVVVPDVQLRGPNLPLQKSDL